MSDTTPAPNATPTGTPVNKRKRDDDSEDKSVNNSAKRKRLPCWCLCAMVAEKTHSFFLKKTSDGSWAPPAVVPLGDDVMVFLTTYALGRHVNIPFTCHKSALSTVCAFLDPRIGAHEGMPGFQDVTKQLLQLVRNYLKSTDVKVGVLKKAALVSGEHGKGKVACVHYAE